MPLTPTQKKDVREAISFYCDKAEASRLKWHYTQQRPITGYYPTSPATYHAADCSGYCGIIFDYAGVKAGVHLESPLGSPRGWGYTGSEYEYLKRHPAPKDRYLVGDMAIFGTSGRTVHTSICKRAGTTQTAVFSSNGHESWVFGLDAPEAISLTHEIAQQHLVGVYRHPQLL